MRVITFPKLPDNLKAGDILASALGPGPNEGVTYAQMAIRLPIAQKLKKAKASIKLEDAEWTELKGCVERTQWLGLSEEIFSICQAVIDAPLDKEKDKQDASDE